MILSFPFPDRLLKLVIEVSTVISRALGSSVSRFWCSLQFAVFLFFTIWSSCFIKNANEFQIWYTVEEDGGNLLMHFLS